MRRWWLPRATARWWITRGWCGTLGVMYAVLAFEFMANAASFPGRAPFGNGAAFMLAAALLVGLAVLPEASALRVLAAAVAAFATGSRAIEIAVTGRYAPARTVVSTATWMLLSITVPFIAGLTERYATRGRPLP
jgi:hypothetical protein